MLEYELNPSNQLDVFYEGKHVGYIEYIQEGVIYHPGCLPERGEYFFTEEACKKYLEKLSSGELTKKISKEAEEKENVWNYCYELDMFEAINCKIEDQQVEVLQRIPGGWIYTIGNPHGLTTTFIPFDNSGNFGKKYFIL